MKKRFKSTKFLFLPLILIICLSIFICNSNRIINSGYNPERPIASKPATYTNDYPDGSPRMPYYTDAYMSDPNAIYDWYEPTPPAGWSQYDGDGKYYYVRYGGTIFSSWNILYFVNKFDTLRDPQYTLSAIEIIYSDWVAFYGTTSSYFRLWIYNYHNSQYESLDMDYWTPPYPWQFGESHYVTRDQGDLADGNLLHYVGPSGEITIRSEYRVYAIWTWIFPPFWGQWNSIIMMEDDQIVVRTLWELNI